VDISFQSVEEPIHRGPAVVFNLEPYRACANLMVDPGDRPIDGDLVSDPQARSVDRICGSPSRGIAVARNQYRRRPGV
jgi:hypothetical protein